MYNEIKNIYELLYSNITTPYNLLDNAKLPNYSYVKYFKGNNGLIVEMECDIKEEGSAIFLYHFDDEDKLEMVVKKIENVEETVFSRSEELERAVKRYNFQKGKKPEAVI